MYKGMTCTPFYPRGMLMAWSVGQVTLPYFKYLKYLMIPLSISEFTKMDYYKTFTIMHYTFQHGVD